MGTNSVNDELKYGDTPATLARIAEADRLERFLQELLQANAEGEISAADVVDELCFYLQFAAAETAES